MSLTQKSYLEATARGRLQGIVDTDSFTEFLPPTARVTSPHLRVLDTPAAFDDGIIVGQAMLAHREILIAAQEGQFMGGAVGEVHGAKLTGLLLRAAERKPAGVVLLLESGGVRLHEANAGLIAVSEVLRAVLAAREAGVPVIAAIGGAYGCFGGMGIVACCCDTVIMSEAGRLGLSGPEVIETANGVEEFDSRDRARVWRTVGGKHRYLLGDADVFVDDDLGAFRTAIVDALREPTPLTLEAIEDEHRRLAIRLADFGAMGDAIDIWRALGIDTPENLPALGTTEFLAAATGHRHLEQL